MPTACRRSRQQARPCSFARSDSNVVAEALGSGIETVACQQCCWVQEWQQVQRYHCNAVAVTVMACIAADVHHRPSQVAHSDSPCAAGAASAPAAATCHRRGGQHQQAQYMQLLSELTYILRRVHPALIFCPGQCVMEGRAGCSGTQQAVEQAVACQHLHGGTVSPWLVDCRQQALLSLEAVPCNLKT
jgi:hypothetical protein